MNMHLYIRGLLVMIFSSMLAGLLFVELDSATILCGSVFCLLLVTMAAIDYCTGLLPDRGNLFLAGLGLVFVVFADMQSLREALLGAAI